MGFSKIENLIIIVLKNCGSVPAIVGWQNRFLLLRVDFWGLPQVYFCNLGRKTIGEYLKSN